jgi:hypothetical protein
VSKCQECQKLYDFSSAQIDSKAKATKTQLLKHLASSFTIPQIVRTLSAENLALFYKMLAVNLFRPLPTLPSVTVTETPDSLCDSAWPHLSLVYDAFLASFNCPQLPSALNGTFLYNLIGNASSPDERERVAVRGILHAMYTKFMNLRTLIREKVACQFTTGTCSGEILEFFVSVVSGYNSPLNPEHVSYFHRFVLPLHTLHHYPQFATLLGQLVIQYVAKSGFLLDPAVGYLLKHWPRGNRQKQSLFLRELESLFCSFEIHVTAQMSMAVFRLIGETAVNENADVAHTAISILMNGNLGFILKAHAAQCYPLLVEPTYRAARRHWDDIVRSNAFVALQNLSELDPITFTQVKDGHKTAKTKNASQVSQVQTSWKKVFEAAKNADPTIRGAILDAP